MVVVQYQNYYSPGFGLVVPRPFQNLKRFLAKGAVHVPAEAGTALAAGAAASGAQQH